MDKYEFIPKRRRWFVQRNDYGRSWSIQPVEEDAQGYIRTCEIIPGRKYPNLQDQPIGTRSAMQPGNTLTGCEDWTSFCTPEEAQGLMNALWEAGMRPSRA